MIDDDGYDIVKAEMFLESRNYRHISAPYIEKDMTIALCTKIFGNRIDFIHLTGIDKELGTYFGVYDHRMMVFFNEMSKRQVPISQSIWRVSESGHDTWPLNNSEHKYHKNRIYLIEDELAEFIREECLKLKPGYSKHKNLSGLTGFFRKHILSTPTIDDYVVRK